MNPVEIIKAAVNAALEAAQEDGFRSHLGASVIGHVCAREIWYIWRWAQRDTYDGRQLRLFDRGNREEIRFATWLMNAGIAVERVNQITGKQFRISDWEEHFGGSKDAHLYNVPGLDASVLVLGEFKTHNDKQYKNLVKSGVAGSHWSHFVQMQVYMGKSGARYSLYCAVNKNDDDLHFEWVEYNEAIATEYMTRAGRIIASPVPPMRISESPGWWQCKMCNKFSVCHENMPLAINCRTCVNSMPIAGGAWYCRMYGVTLSTDEQKTGCTSHSPIRQD